MEMCIDADGEIKPTVWIGNQVTGSGKKKPVAISISEFIVF